MGKSRRGRDFGREIRIKRKDPKNPVTGRTTMDREINEKMIRVCESLNRMLNLTFQGFRKSTEMSVKEAEEVRKEVQRFSSELTQFLVGRSLSRNGGKEWVKPYLSIVSGFDRMGYNLDGILDRLKKKVHEQVLFTDRAIHEVSDVFQETIHLLENLPDLVLTQNKLLAQQIELKGKVIFEMTDNYSQEHEQRLIEGVCVPKSSPLYLDILFSLKGIVAQTIEISEKMMTLSAKA
jgi:Na+/phosphate symporter